MIELKPGQIIVLEGVNVITIAQGDTRAKHVCMVAEDPNFIWSTGEGPLWTYGRINAKKYLKGKRGVIGETVVPLTAEHLADMEATHKAMKGQIYGGWKIEELLFDEAKYGLVPYVGSYPNPSQIIKHPICSQAAGCVLWREAVPVGFWRGKMDATALLPDDFFMEIQRGVLLKKVTEF